MRAWQYTTVDDKLEQALVLNESGPAPDKASLAPGQILVEVLSAALNPVDFKLPESGWIGRLMIGRPATPGTDFCGRVVAKHASDSAFEEGDRVFGGLPDNSKIGTLSEFIIVSTSCCAKLPDSVEPDYGAAVGIAATTAYQSLPSDDVKPGANVFINGGTGGVGTWSIQIAKARGATVTTTCSSSKVKLCKDLGADHVIDYKEVDVCSELTKTGEQFDIVVDNVGIPALYEFKSAFLKHGGIFVQVGIGPVSAGQIFTSLGRKVLPTRLQDGRRYDFIMMRSETKLYSQLGEWMVTGKAKPVIAAIFEFEDVPKAYEMLRQGHTNGKIVVHVGGKSN